MKRIISGILAFCLILSLLPVSALAEEIPEETAAETVAEETVPEEAVPEETLPEETLPEDTIPEETAPEETAPEETVPEETVPEETVPEETVPEETVPEETVPEEAVPEETEPEVTLPEETVPEETMPEETVSGEEDEVPEEVPDRAYSSRADTPTEPNGILIQDKKAGTMIHEMPQYKFTAPSEGKAILSMGTTSEHHILELTDKDGFLMDPIVKERKEYGGAYPYGWAQEYFLPAGVYYARIVPNISLDGYASYWVDFTLYHECGYTYEIEEPTCTEEGGTIYTCAYCGYWYNGKPVAPLGHENEDLARIEPTCTALGKEPGTRCTRCGEITSGREDIPILPHTEATIPYVSPTCTGKGKTAGVECAVCKGILIAQEDIPVLPHTEIIVPGTAATCTSSGKANVTKCTVCEEEVSYTSIPALGHDFDGYFCKRCGNADSSQIQQYGVCGDNLSWVLTTDDVLIISGTGDMWDNPDLPGRSWIDAVIKEGVTSIGAYAFDGGIRSASIPGTVTRIGDYAFANSKIVEIPEGVQTIGDYAFKACRGGLTSLTLPKSLRTIGEGAFLDCQKLETVTFQEGLRSIGKEAFSGCKSISGRITVPDSVTSMGDHAFSGCIKLPGVTFGNGLTKVPEAAFASCRKLSGVTFGDNITRIEESAFANCSAFAYIGLNKVSYVETYAFLNAGSDNGQFGITVEMPKCITIESGAFAGAKVDYVDYEGTKSDEWYYVNNSDSSIFNAFWNYSGYSADYKMSWNYSALHLTVTGKGTISSYSSADTAPWYEHREEMEYVTIDKDISSIGSNAFNGYSNLKQIRFLGSAPSFADDTVFAGVTATVYYPAGDSSWSESVRQNYGGNLTWKASCSGSCTAVTDEAVAATCTETGLTQGSHCSACGVVIHAQETVKTVGHTYLTQKAKLPTCTETGLTKGSYCGFCGLVEVKQEVVPALGHTPVTDEAKEPECLTEGLSEGSHCDVCQVILTEQETIPALGHNKVAMEEIPATCYEEGSTGGVHCDTCGRVFVIPKKTPVLIHEPQIVPGFAPTCTEDGETESTKCVNCGEVYQEPEVIPALGHDMITDNDTPATCTQPGHYAGAHCSRCDHTEGGGEIPALGHKPGAAATCTAAQLCTVCKAELAPAKGHTEAVSQAVVPTCTKDGLTEGKYCSVCNEILVKQEVVKALGHKEVVDQAKAPTCTETGLTEGKHCSACNETLIKQEVVSALGHDLIPENEIPATCTQPGYQSGAHCSRCDYTEGGGEIPALGHTPGAAATCTAAQLCTVCKAELAPAKGHTEAVSQAVAPTCTTDGLTEGKYCSVCNVTLVKQEVVKALGHKEVVDQAKAPTCTETGLTEGKHCSVCKETLIRQEVVSALGHDLIPENEIPATCTQPGSQSGAHCSRCDYTEGGGEIPALGHTPGAAATCTEAQLCTVCKAELAPAKGHTEAVSQAVAPTCTKDGLTEGKYCSVCNEILVKQEEVKALGHKEVVDQAKAPTCTETGLTEGKHCSACNETLIKQEAVSALGHDLITENETPATCTQPGYHSGGYCSRCDYTEGGGQIPALGHNEVIVEALAPTCTETGYTEGKYCDRCGETLVQQSPVPATGHTEKTLEAIPPTCTEAGLTEGKYCSVCNETLVKQEEVKALGHKEVIDPAKAATCTETGLTEGKHCSVCNETLIKQEVVSALGHDLIAENETPATCTTPGYHSGGYCSRCDYTEGGGEIPALGHSEVVDAGFAASCTEAGLTDGKHCDRCGEILEKQEEIPALGHTEKTVEAVPPTCTESGLTEGKTCEVCGLLLEAQEEVPALGHAFELGACRVCGEKDPTGGALSDTVGWRVEEETGALVLSGSGAAVGSEAAPWADFADRITTLVVGPEITEIDSSIFDSLPGLKAFAVEESNPSYTGQGATLLSKDGTVLVKQLGTGEESFTVPEGIRSIAPKAFAGCDSLQQIRFTGSLPTFAEDCFLGLTVDALYPYDDPSWTAAELGNYGGTVTWMETGRVIASGFCGEDRDSVSWELTADGTLTISGQGEMNDFLFDWDDYAEQITQVVICEGVTHVGGSAFYYSNSRIRTVQLPETLRSIGAFAFMGCSSLQEIIIPENVSVMGEAAFFNCDSLTKITIPAVVTELGGGVFGLCDNLQEITFLGSAPKFKENDVFNSVTATVYYPGADITWKESLRKNYGGKLTWVPQYEQEEVTQIAAPGTELLSGEEMVLSAVLEPGILKDAKILWALEEGSHAVTLEPQGAAAVLTAGEITEETTVIISAKAEGGTMEPARITLTLKPAAPEVPADHQIFSGKSITLKAYDPDTGKALTNKKITWQLVSRNADAYASISKSGKLTAKQVLAKTRVTAAAIWLDSGETLATFAVDILPAATQLEVRQAGQLVNGKTVPVDYATNTLILTADAYPLDTLKDIQWSISDSKKHAYAEDYIISGNTVTVVSPTGKAGTVTVKATVNAGVKKTVTVKLQFSGFAKEVRIVPPAKTTIEGGESLQLTAAVVNSGTVTKPGIVWSIPDKADKTAATISSKGLLKAKKVKQPETITVVAASKDGKASAQVQITIMPEDSFALYLMHEQQYVTGTTQTLNLGDTYQLKVCRKYDGETYGDWSSSKPSVATVSEDGLVTAVGKGTAKITVKQYGEKPVSVTVKVTSMVNGMTLTAKDKKTLVQENGETIVRLAASKSVTLTAAVQPTGANKSVTWDLVSGGAYAKISASGKLTANKDLTSVQYVVARATAKDGSGYSETIRVRLHPLAQGVQIYSVQNGRTVFSVRSDDNWWNHSNTTLEWDLNQGSKLQLSSHVYPYYGEDSGRNAIQGVTWKSSSPKIATVNEDGLVTCRKSGTVTITATAADGSGKKVSFKLKVVKLVTQLKIADQTVFGGKTLNLAKLITVGPADATNKKLTWEITGGDGAAYATLSKTGTLKTKKVFTPKTVEITVTAQDGSGTQTLLLVTIR